MKILINGRLIRFLLFYVILTVLAGTFPVLAGNRAIKDLDASSGYSREAIVRLFEKGVITGDDNGKFHPGQNITRGQMTAIISRLLTLDTSRLPQKATFKDVPPEHWAFPYVEAAYREGIVTGISSDTFGVNAFCTREEMTVMFARSLGTPANEIAQYGSAVKLGKLTDGDRLSGWSRNYVGLALARGLVEGTDAGSFSPAEYSTREQAAAVAGRFMDKYPVLKAPGTAAGTLTIKDIAALEESVVLIKTFDKDNNGLAQGSGFAVAGGLFLTNWHVLEGASKYTVTDARGKEYEIQGVVKYDELLDLAVIKARDQLNIKPLAVGSKNFLSAGDEVVAIGSPQGLQNSVSNGSITALYEEIAGVNKKIQVIEMNIDITHGSSGGPLLDMQGRVAGVVTAMAEDGVLKYAVAIDHAAGWIKELKTKPFNGLKVLDMSAVTEAYWKILDDEVKDTVAASFEALEEEDVEAYMDTIHKLNPAYNTIRQTYGKLFSIYDFDYTLESVKVLNKDMSSVTVEVNYKVRRTGKTENVLIGAMGYYKLALQGDEYKIYYAGENLYFPEGGGLTGADLISR